MNSSYFQVPNFVAYEASGYQDITDYQYEGPPPAGTSLSDFENRGPITPFDTSVYQDHVIPEEWTHFAFTFTYGNYGNNNNLRVGIYKNGQLVNVTTGRWDGNEPGLVNVRLNGRLEVQQYETREVTFGQFVSDWYRAPIHVNEVALYRGALSPIEIWEHYDFIANSSPNRTYSADLYEVTAAMPNSIVQTSKNRVFPATVIVGASGDITDPSLNIQVGATYISSSLNGTALIRDPEFAGNPDAIIVSNSIPVSAEFLENIFRLDTAYESYVKTNFAPHRYVSFDDPNNFSDNGSDNDYLQATPFVYSGEITASITGLNNNSLLSSGIDYATDGVILKESEWNDDWGTSLGACHSAFWIKRHPSDTNSSGIRTIQSAYGKSNGSFFIVYQNNNYISIDLFNGTNFYTATSQITVNAFDYSKHFIVTNFKNNTSSYSVEVYVDKTRVINLDIGTAPLILTNSTASSEANSETNNFARMSVGGLIVPILETAFTSTPIATKMFIDDVHWSQTSISSSGVTDLWNAMPYREAAAWAADVMLSLNSFIINPSVSASNVINVLDLSASSLIVDPSIITDFDKTIFAPTLEASADSVEPFEYFGDNVNNIEVNAETLFASSTFVYPGVVISITGSTMYASVTAVNSSPYLDPYHLLVVQQTLQPIGSPSLGSTWPIGDIN
jgi:hypothetical protein